VIQPGIQRIPEISLESRARPDIFARGNVLGRRNPREFFAIAHFRSRPSGMGRIKPYNGRNGLLMTTLSSGPRRADPRSKWRARNAARETRASFSRF
jgi:hypothetical protein